MWWFPSAALTTGIWCMTAVSMTTFTTITVTTPSTMAGHGVLAGDSAGAGATAGIRGTLGMARFMVGLTRTAGRLGVLVRGGIMAITWSRVTSAMPWLAVDTMEEVAV